MKTKIVLGVLLVALLAVGAAVYFVDLGAMLKEMHGG